MRRRQKIPKKPKVTLDGSVYVIKLEIGGLVVYKVGVTTWTVAARVLGIIESFWKMYGYFPRVEIVQEERTRNHYRVEALIHKRLREAGYSYDSEYTFSGCTELFTGIAEGELIMVYRECMDSDEDVREESLDRISDIM